MRLHQLVEAATPRQRAVSTALAVVVAALALLPLLGHKPLAEWDEAIYAEAAREMLGGSWLTPHWNGALWLEKPPLMLWVTAFFYKIFGVNELAARLGSALSGVAIAGVLHGWLAGRRDRLTAWLSTLILLATFGFLHVCHVGEMDVLLSLGTVLALIGLVEIDELRPRGWFWFWFGFAIALMTKGAAAIVIPVAAVGYALAQRWRLRHFGGTFLFGLALFTAAVLPWHLAMFHRYGHEFFAQYLGLQVLHRAAVQMEGHYTHWWFYLMVLAVSAPPFCLLFPAALDGGLRSAELRAWALFALTVIILFSTAQTRLPHYIAPAYPALALLTAVWLGEFLKARIVLPAEARPAGPAWGFRAGSPSPPIQANPRTSGLAWGFSAESRTSPEGAGTRRSGSAWGFSPTNHRTRKGGALAPALLAAALIWPVSILLTHSTLKSLHSATLAGPGLLDNREADTLLRRADVAEAPAPGPLLVWRAGRVQSIATLVFYARRPVQQVALSLTPQNVARDRYMFDPMPLSDAVTAEPRLILLDRSLLPGLPPNLRFTPIAEQGSVALGTVTLGNEN